jgi:hypothetical protein
MTTEPLAGGWAWGRTTLRLARTHPKDGVAPSAKDDVLPVLSHERYRR